MATIMLLEDQPFIALDIEMLLGEYGHDHVTFSTCADAKQWLNDHTPSTAIVDPRLSDGLCAEVVRILVERGTPFIVYSGEAESLPEIEPAFAEGEQLSKPCEPELLVAAVARALKDRPGQV